MYLFFPFCFFDRVQPISETFTNTLSHPIHLSSIHHSLFASLSVCSRFFFATFDVLSLDSIRKEWRNGKIQVKKILFLAEPITFNNRFDAFFFVSFNINTNRTHFHPISRLVWTQARAAKEMRCLTDHVKIQIKNNAWKFNNYWSAVISVQINRFPIFVRRQKNSFSIFNKSIG